MAFGTWANNFDTFSVAKNTDLFGDGTEEPSND